jgi:nucleotide-binding universal stress UspA family protein
MDKLTSILAAVDFFPSSASAVAQALRIAAWNRSGVRAVHVVDTLVALEADEIFTVMQESIRGELVEDARRRWTAFAAGVPGAAGLTFAVRVGSRVLEVLDEVRDAAADLLVMGTQGDSKPETGAGPFAAQCVREAPCDVLLVRKDKVGPFKHVVAAVDFSPTSRRALERAVRLCVQDNATLDVVHAFDPPWYGVLGRIAGYSTPAEQDAYRQRLVKHLQEFCQPSAPGDSPGMSWVRPRFHLPETSSHGMGIVELAKSVQADLVVLGTRGRSSMKELLLGTTAARVVRAAACSILAVKP